MELTASPEGGHRLEQEHGDHHARPAGSQGGRLARGGRPGQAYFPAVDREDAAAAETRASSPGSTAGLGLMMSAMVESRQLTEADIAELSAILEDEREARNMRESC